MKNIRMLWPEGRRGAVTSTWDDGTEFDRKLVSIFDRHGLKGSFFLNSGALGLSAQQSGWKAYVRADEVRALYARHEVGSHTVSHPHPWQIPPAALRQQFVEDRGRLEALVGYPVRGAVVPFGWSSGWEHMAEVLGALGFRYMRHTNQTNVFELPADFMLWRPTAHIGCDLLELWARFEAEAARTPGSLLNIWGHSYEFEDGRRWDHMSAFAEKAGACGAVWHATAGEVFDYVSAWRRMEWTADLRFARNLSALDLWFDGGGRPTVVPSGALFDGGADGAK